MYPNVNTELNGIEDADRLVIGLIGSCMMLQEYQEQSMKIKPECDVVAQQICAANVIMCTEKDFSEFRKIFLLTFRQS